MSKLRHNGLKSPMSKYSQKLSYNFESKSNKIVFMLDVSSYMMIYNYGSKAFPIKNMEEIIIFLLKNIVKRYKNDKED